MMHSGKCDCGCGQHSIWSIVKVVNQTKLWFLCIDHMHRWEEQQRRIGDQWQAALAHRASLRLVHDREDRSEDMAEVYYLNQAA